MAYASETDLSDDRFGKEDHQLLQGQDPLRIIAGGGTSGRGPCPSACVTARSGGVAVDRAVELIVSHIEQRSNAD